MPSKPPQWKRRGKVNPPKSLALSLRQKKMIAEATTRMKGWSRSRRMRARERIFIHAFCQAEVMRPVEFFLAQRMRYANLSAQELLVLRAFHRGMTLERITRARAHLALVFRRLHALPEKEPADWKIKYSMLKSWGTVNDSLHFAQRVLQHYRE